MATPLSVVHLDRVGSTQDEAAARHAGAPVLVTATGQDAGRGRSGARWLDADRSVAASLALEPAWPPARVAVITLVAGLAALDVLPPRVGLDWPNDLVVPDGKVGGILTESRGGRVVIGIGLNVHWADPPAGMAALHREDPGVEHARGVAERWAGALLARLERGAAHWGRDEYADRCTTLGRRITWEPDGEGRAVGIDEDGSLLVDAAGRLVALRSGAVRKVEAE